MLKQKIVTQGRMLARVVFLGVIWLFLMAAQLRADDGWTSENTLRISLEGPRAYRVFTLSDPMRVVVDIKEHDWTGKSAGVFAESDFVSTARVGVFQPEWSRLVMDLTTPVALSSARISSDASANGLILKFRNTGVEEFNATSGTPDSTTWFARTLNPTVRPDPNGLLIAIDPGHGGIDPGAIRDGVEEKAIALAFAREFRDAVENVPHVTAFLIRETDMFVALDDRVGLARAADADVFISIHANTVELGNAEGATVFTLSAQATDAASARIAALENNADNLAGLEVESPADDVSKMLVDMARLETNARSEKLGKDLLASLVDNIEVIRSNSNPRAGFRVLRAPDVPSVLIELGFMSNARDRARMMSPDWRRKAANAVLSGILAWAKTDAALAPLALQ